MSAVSTLNTSRAIPVRRLGWMGRGRAMVERACEALAQRRADLEAPSALPGWSRADVLAHLARGADAFVALAEEAAGRRRGPGGAEGTAVGAQDDVLEWACRSAARLDQVTLALPRAAWLHPVHLAPGHTGPFRDIAWLRARETMVHVVDLDLGTTFADLPIEFCHDLLDDAAAVRSAAAGPALLLVTPGAGTWTVAGSGPTTAVVGAVPDLAQWIAGRGAGGVRPVPAADRLPDLPAWP